MKSLDEYFAANENEYFRLISKTASGYPSYVFGHKNAIYRAIDRKETDTTSLVQIEDFSYDDDLDECNFGIAYHWFNLSKTQPSTDIWGNTADWEDGVYFKNKDCWWFCFSDAAGNFWSDEWDLPENVENAENIEHGFSEWLFDNYENYDFISCIETSNVSEGTADYFTYYTSNKKLGTTEWNSLFSDFVAAKQV